MAAAVNSQNKRKNFGWSSEMIESLIESLIEYKTQMSYKGIDFHGDKPMQYKELRLQMAEIYKEDITLLVQCMLIVCLMISMICQKRKKI